MILLVLALALVLWLAERWSLQNALVGIDYAVKCSALLVEPDETFELITTVSNASRRFVPFLQLDEMLPAQVKVHSDAARLSSSPSEGLRSRASVYLMPKSRLVRRVKMSLPARGRYLFRGATLRGGDFLGLSETGAYFSAVNEIVVCPRPAAVPDVTGMLGGFLGEVSVRRFIIEDPVLTVGSREYTGREPMKNISWNHSARLGHLMVKQFDYTVEPSVSVLLDVDTPPREEGRQALLENCFSLARSVCALLEEKGIKYDFVTNATTGGALSLWNYAGEGLGVRHYQAILEGLGRATYDATEPFEETMERTVRGRASSKATIVITPRRDAEKQRVALRAGERSGGKVALLYGEDAGP